MDITVQAEPIDYSSTSPLADMDAPNIDICVGSEQQKKDDGQVYSKEEIKSLEHSYSVAEMRAQEGEMNAFSHRDAIRAQLAGLVTKEDIKELWRVNATALLQKAEKEFASGEIAECVENLSKVDNIVSQYNVSIDSKRMVSICEKAFKACKEDCEKSEEQEKKLKESMEERMEDIMAGRSWKANGVELFVSKNLSASLKEVEMLLERWNQERLLTEMFKS
jgi:hypothetical protein